ncbi:hypothetical protein JR316_0011149 [Psilocybe cubensis]|uniref:Uncharacterized protein n=2 Tax=Psilocybe cubensis TaxID=181762 RepID=A0ACB8GQE7_PSICU|nr:hypothetical protein JR316_0011149 [Psilocybe cubensis]KAH9477230.1 hypothetical protein JR316_0011149 [Psilocybe cubensis]
MSSTSSSNQPDPFGFNSECNSGSDTQLMTDTFSNIINSTYTFRCCLDGFGCIDQSGSPFHACGENIVVDSHNLGNYPTLTLCIGGTFEQHACAADGCQAISRSAVISKPCPPQLVDYMKVQPMGSQFACCDSSSCVLGNDYSCASSRSLQICIGDGIGTECINPADLAICSGNFSSASTAGAGGASTSGSNPQIPPPSSPMNSSPAASSPTSSHSGLGPSDIATIVGSTLGVFTSVIGAWLGYREIKKRKLLRRSGLEDEKKDGTPVPAREESSA